VLAHAVRDRPAHLLAADLHRRCEPVRDPLDAIGRRQHAFADARALGGGTTAGRDAYGREQ